MLSILSTNWPQKTTHENLRTYRVRGGVRRFYGQRILSRPKATLPHLTKYDEPIFTGLSAVKVSYVRLRLKTNQPQRSLILMGLS